MTNPIEQVCIPIPELREKYEKEAIYQIIAAIELFNGNKKLAADYLGMKRTTLVMYIGRHAPELLRYRWTKKKKTK